MQGPAPAAPCSEISQAGASASSRTPAWGGQAGCTPPLLASLHSAAGHLRGCRCHRKPPYSLSLDSAGCPRWRHAPPNTPSLGFRVPTANRTGGCETLQGDMPWGQGCRGPGLGGKEGAPHIAKAPTETEAQGEGERRASTGCPAARLRSQRHSGEITWPGKVRTLLLSSDATGQAPHTHPWKAAGARSEPTAGSYKLLA